MEDAAGVAALVADDLRPTVGDVVTLTAAWEAPWPAQVAWSGVDSDEGIVARVTASAVGPLEVSANGTRILVQVQPAANLGNPVVRAPVAVPIYALDAGACRDDRYPALSGPWLVGCGADGRVDRAVHLGTRAEVRFVGDAGAVPGLGGGAVYDAANARLWRLPGTEPTQVAHLGEPPVGPPATDGAHLAVAFADHVEAFDAAAATRLHTDARPLPGAQVAMAWPWVAWVQAEANTGEDVWVKGAGPKARPLARGPGAEWHVAGDERWLAWAGEGAVWVEDPARGERRRHDADTGFLGELSMWGPVVCWEERALLRANVGDIDVACSDGVLVRRPGDQVAPQRLGPWVVFREAGHVMLATVPELILDDDDPRAEGPGATVAGGFRGAHREGEVAWTFTWPAEGWRVERWSDGAWAPGEVLPTGRVTVTHPGGDAIRLVPK